jgi:hypothetical protein
MMDENFRLDFLYPIKIPVVNHSLLNFCADLLFPEATASRFTADRRRSARPAPRFEQTSKPASGRKTILEQPGGRSRILCVERVALVPRATGTVPSPLRTKPPKPAWDQKAALERPAVRSRAHPIKLSLLTSATGDDLYLASAKTAEASCRSKGVARVARLTAPQAQQATAKFGRLQAAPGTSPAPLRPTAPKPARVQERPSPRTPPAPELAGKLPKPTSGRKAAPK